MPVLESEQAVFKPIFDFLKQEANRRKVNVKLHTHLAKRDGNYIHLPVYVPGEALDAVEKAHILQTLEDSWNNREPEPSLQVLLVPTAD